MGQIKCFSISVQGASHKKIDKICQDSSKHHPATKKEAKYTIVAVSDGHGGDKYFRSHIGSQQAVKVAISSLHNYLGASDFMKTIQDNTISGEKKDDLVTALEESIIAKWNKDIKLELEKNEFTDNELAPLDDEYKEKILDKSLDYRFKTYGATLIVAVVFDNFWLGFQIGDGTFVIKQNGEYSQPIELDPKCVGVNVTSICDANAIRYFHHAWGYGVPEAIFIASDGVDESFATVEGLYKFYDNIIKNSNEDWDGNVKEIEAYLPELSEKGSRDDVSLAAIIKCSETVETVSNGGDS